MSSELTKDRWRRMYRHSHPRHFWQGAKRAPHRVFITFSHDLDESFVEMFRKRAKQETRLLIFNGGISTDHLISKILDLQIRKPERCYVVEGKFGSGKTAFFHAYLERFLTTFKSNDERDRIFDARIENESLRVVSPKFDRIEVPLSKIPQFKDAKRAQLLSFEIDEDGSFIYWPDIDVHIGWRQLQQLINPEAALKALQKSGKFNERYGRAVQKLREAAGLKRNNVIGLSEKQTRKD